MFSLFSRPFACFFPCLQYVQPPIAQPSSVWLVLIHPLLSPGWPPPGSTSCTQWSSDCGRRQTGAGLPGPSVAYSGTLGYVRNLSRPQLPCLKIRSKDSSYPESCKDEIRNKQNCANKMRENDMMCTAQCLAPNPVQAFLAIIKIIISGLAWILKVSWDYLYQNQQYYSELQLFLALFPSRS